MLPAVNAAAAAAAQYQRELVRVMLFPSLSAEPNRTIELSSTVESPSFMAFSLLSR